MTDSRNSAMPGSHTGVEDKYGVPYRVCRQEENGTILLQRLVPPMMNQHFSMVRTPAYGCPSRLTLESLYELSREDGSIIEELLLPVSTVEAPEQGVILSVPVDKMMNGARWEPKLLDSSAPWAALSRLADALAQAGKQKIFPVKLTRDMLFVSPDQADIRLVVTESGTLLPAMRKDLWLAAALPPELSMPNQEHVGVTQNAYMLATLILSILQCWKPAAAAPQMDLIPLVESLPEMYPKSEALKKTLMQAFTAVPEDRPTAEYWRDLLLQCAQEMEARHAAPRIPRDHADTAAAPLNVEPILPDFPAMETVSPNGTKWRIGAGHEPILPAEAICCAFRLPESGWSAWHPAFDSLTTAVRRQFNILCVPDDYVAQGDASLLLFSRPIAASQTGWNGLLPSADSASIDVGQVTRGLKTIALLLDELALGEQHGLYVTALDAAQFISGIQYRLVLCGQNLGKTSNPRLASQLVQMLMNHCTDASWLPLEIRQALHDDVSAPLSLLKWQKLLHFAADSASSCIVCGHQHLLNSACPHCNTTTVALQICRDQGIREEQVDMTLSDTEAIRFSELYPGEAEKGALIITYDTAARKYSIRNVCSTPWRYRLGTAEGTLNPGRFMLLTPGLRLLLIPRKLELRYAWPQ